MTETSAKSSRRRRTAMMVVAIVLAAVLTPLISVVSTPAPASATANAALFNAGNIISDALFYDGGAMTGDQVEAFLQGQVRSCASGYTCLKDYRQDTPNMPTGSCVNAYAGAGNERAADIIAKVGAACNISQRVLIVLLQKEQSLVTATAPSTTAYARATGFSCPDSAPCDPAYAGFFYQVYNAARQFQNYAQNPSHFNYQAGRNNNILYNPDPGCGTSAVFIQNKATAGLYDYTPYQPNTAALNNLYGTGDGCSTYGNRNFWRLFTDWFGSPTAASSLLRSVTDATIYLVSGDTKYPINSLTIYGALAPLGPLGYVSDQYLAGLTTGHLVGRTIRDPGGTIYFYDSGIKLPLSSCGQAADYGASCDISGYVQLTDVQAAAFATGPTLTSVLGTTTGARYYIHAGTKAEILDDQSQAAAGIPVGMNVLSDDAVSGLTLAAPIIRDGTFALTRGTSSFTLLSGGTGYPVPPGSASALGVPARTTGTLLAQSLALLPSGPAFTGVVQAPGAPGVSLLAADGAYSVSGGGFSATTASTPVSAAFLAGYPAKGAIAPGSFIMSPSNATVYIVMPADIRPISGWDALLALTTTSNPPIAVVSDATISLFPQGPVALDSGTLVRSPGNATVYLVDGVTDRIPFGSFVFAVEAGLTSFSFSTDQRIQAYPQNSKLLGFGLTCGTTNYVAAGGSVHAVGAASLPLYPFDYVTLDQFLCAKLTVGAPAGSFIRTPDGSIYQLLAGRKLPISTMTRFTQLGGQSWLDVAAEFGAAIPTGPNA